MEKFNRVLRGYDPEEVNNFIDHIIEQVENMVNEIKEKDLRIKELEEQVEDTITLKNRIEHYEKMEDTLNRAIIMAEKTSEQIKLNAHQERETITNDAKKNASRIINEALLKAEKIDNDAETVKRNMNILKKRLRDILESQLELVDDIERIDV